MSSILSQALPLAEEAALLYANGRARNAAEALERALAPGGGHGRDLRMWGMLFDLHRAEGDWRAFERLATRFEAQFGRSAPTWLPEDVVAHLPESMRAGGAAYFEIVGPLDRQAAAKLEAMRDRAGEHGTLHLDLSRAREVEGHGCGILSDTLRFLSSHGTGVLVTGVDQFLRTLRQAAEGNPAVRAYWSLLLDLYQLGNMQADFERAALEYALATGGEPPLWQTQVRAVVAPPPVEEKRDEPRYQSHPEIMSLSGVMRGAADPQLRELDRFAEAREYVNLNLAQLTRMDFACAAGFNARLNNWARGGKTVRLIRPNALLGALLASFSPGPGVVIVGTTEP